MSFFYFVRHGDSEAMEFLPGRSPGVHLSSTGRNKVDQLAQNIKHLHIDFIYSSPLERTWETASILGEAFNIEPITRESLIEIDTGEFTLKSLAELENMKSWQSFHTHKSLTAIPGGELFLQVQNRMVTEIETLRRMHQGKHIIIVSHGDPIKSVLEYYTGIPIDFSSRIVIRTSALSILKIEDDGAELICLNYSPWGPEIWDQQRH